MKLILASDVSFLISQGYALTGIPKEQMRIGYVTTAFKAVRTPTFFENVKKIIRENGYAFDEVDIEAKTKAELRDFLRDHNVIHIEGGNTFYLLKAIRETGFDEILKEQLDEGKTVIGTSAGAYVMCPSIEVANWNNDGKDRFGLTDFTALNYVPFCLKVHFTNEKKELIKENMKTLKYPLRILRDGQGILVENETYTFVGEGEEVKI